MHTHCAGARHTDMRANSDTSDRLYKLYVFLPDGLALLGDVGVPHSGDAPVIVLAALLIVSFALLIAPAHHVLHDPGKQMN